MAVTDMNAMGDIQNLAGSVKKIADDLAVVAGTNANDYFAASPSEVERRTFGDTILSLNSKFDTTQNLSAYTKTKWQRKILSSNISSAGDIASLMLNNLTIGRLYRLRIHVRFEVIGNVDASVTANCGSEIVGFCKASQSSGNVNMTTGSMVEFTATSNTVIFTAASAGVFTIVGTSLLNGTYVTLEELPNHEPTTQWT
jgi:hypothetical protein